VRLGGSPNVLDLLPDKPPRMHWLTFYRLVGQAMAAQDRSLGLDIDNIRRRYLGLLSQENVAKS
jgi:hypothetical protein